MLTIIVASLIALSKTDLKARLAYSTVSQLGYMFLALGVGAFGAAVFHLYTHAFFKALLFLGSGSVIHALHEEQDIRKIALALGVAHVLEGSVQRSGDKVRVTAQLIRADDGFHVWSQNYTRPLEDIFAIQD